VGAYSILVQWEYVRPYVRTYGHTTTREGWHAWLSYTTTVGSHVHGAE